MLCDGDLFVVGELPFDMGRGKEVANFLIDKGKVHLVCVTIET